MALQYTQSLLIMLPSQYYTLLSSYFVLLRANTASMTMLQSFPLLPVALTVIRYI